MPYIKQENRLKFKSAAHFLGDTAETSGELNYVVTEITHRYLKKKGVSYAHINEVIGMLDCCRMELYRKIAAPYENGKEAENGPVGLEDNF